MTTNTTQINRRLPALAASLRWYKRETLRILARRALDSTSPAIAAHIRGKASRVRAMRPAQLRASYTSERVADICRSGLFELARVVPTLVRLRAEVSS